MRGRSEGKQRLQMAIVRAAAPSPNTDLIIDGRMTGMRKSQKKKEKQTQPPPATFRELATRKDVSGKTCYYGVLKGLAAKRKAEAPARENDAAKMDIELAAPAAGGAATTATQQQQTTQQQQHCDILTCDQNCPPS